ncbi:MAG: UvrD-helicase domain-containing protein [Halioglobus sp.]
MNIVDLAERSRALDPMHSFCVGAPAGSGKTELLIQRYLTLLARVSRPEQVLAITFTRKAAAEMRARVFEALVDAKRGKPCEGDHQLHTRELASKALQVDEEQGWRLLKNISRLNIKTIDGFCSSLTRQMPVLSEFGGQAEIVDNASELYGQAVTEFFKLIESDNVLGEDLAALMLHFDNNWSQLQELLMAMLGRRDQWRAYIGVHHQAEEAQAYLLRTVNTVVTDALVVIEEKLSPYASQILDLQVSAAGNLQLKPPERSPSSSAGDLSLWRNIRALLLTATGTWRARVDKRMGFPAGKGVAQERKDQIMALIGELKEIDGLLDALNMVMILPEMTPGNASWKMVLHLSRILPMLAAELLLVFGRRGQVDHTQVSLSALQALGEDELPTELALRLDYQLEHILVDEFQDTAINQYELVRRLTRGWGEHNQSNPGSPRTLLVVGDGMQSIYGFRDANVGLFLQARREGFNGVELEYLSLSSNFRSDQGVVDWVNDTFVGAFPDTEDVSRGQIRFTPASAVRPGAEEPAVSLKAFTGENPAPLEVDAICEMVQQGITANDCQSIAILARTRTHLQAILAQFKELEIAYSAQDIDSLASSSVIVDLMSLCRTISNPADRVAWMAVLRAPWCALPLSDLHVIGTAGEAAAYTPVSLLFDDPQVKQQLSADGKNRLANVAGAIGRAFDQRDRLSLRVWIEQLWLALGGAASVPSESHLHDAERFFQLLEQAEREGEGLSISWLQDKLGKLFVQTENPSSKVQVMTLHKAKGLEFDWVIIPSLQKTTRVNAKPLLLWDDHSSASGERGFLLAANDHSADKEPTLYNWLKVQRAEKEILETTRLLYVGSTRAVQKLLLTACVKFDPGKEEYTAPPGRSLLASIWPTFEKYMSVQESVSLEKQEDRLAINRPLYRLDSETVHRLSGASAQRRVSNSANDNIPERVFNREDRYVGTVVHLALEQLSRRAILPQAPIERDNDAWHGALAALGLSGDALTKASERVRQSVSTVLADPTGRWLLSSEHAEASSELPLTRVDESGKVVDIIIDRTFIDSDTQERWVVDYKNSQPEAGESLDDFAQREANTYRDQLRIYRDSVSHMGAAHVQCALYFTALAHMHIVKI